MPDMGPTMDGGVVDAGDAGTRDAGAPEAGPADAGPVDMGPPDAGACCLSEECPLRFACVAGFCAPESSCSDGARNGLELGVDCGGPSCPACVPACDDGRLNGGETDVDCGGATTCGRCGLGRRCQGPSDCRDGVCTLGQCGPTGELLLASLDVPRSGDLGGLTGADEACGVNAVERELQGTWRALLVAEGTGGGPARSFADLVALVDVGSPVYNLCAAYPPDARPTPCSDRGLVSARYDDFMALDGSLRRLPLTFGGIEPRRGAGTPPFTGLAWTGTPRPGAVADTCADWSSARAEDRGVGSLFYRLYSELAPLSCERLASVVCLRTTLACETEVCRCLDGVSNGRETDRDCGGPLCSGCAPGQRCRVASDCADGVCDSGQCAAPTCGDGVRNGTETDVDCGGRCAPCAVGRACAVAADCAEGVCAADSGVCAAATCSDQVANGIETGVDCGAASGCGLCGDGRGCDSAVDCTSGACTSWAPGRETRCGTTFGHLVHFTLELDGVVQPVARQIIGDSAFLSAETGTLRVGFWPAGNGAAVLAMPQALAIIAAIEAEAMARGRVVDIGAGDGYGMTDAETDVYVFPWKDDTYYDGPTDLGERYGTPPIVNAFTARGGVVLYTDFFGNWGGTDMPTLFEDWALRLSTPPDTEPSFLRPIDREGGARLPDDALVCTPNSQRDHPLAISVSRLEAPMGGSSAASQRWVFDVSRREATRDFRDHWHELNITLADEEGFAIVTHFLRSPGD